MVCWLVHAEDLASPTKFAGFDLQQPTAHQGGKPRAIEMLRNKHPYETIVMVGDGITDLEAVQVSGAADLFIGFGGVAQVWLGMPNAALQWSLPVP